MYIHIQFKEHPTIHYVTQSFNTLESLQEYLNSKKFIVISVSNNQTPIIEKAIIQTNSIKGCWETKISNISYNTNIINF